MTDNDSEEPRGASGTFSSVPARVGRYRQQANYFTRLAETEPVVRIRDQWENLARDYASLANTLGNHSDRTLSAALSQLDVVEQVLFPISIAQLPLPRPQAGQPLNAPPAVRSEAVGNLSMLNHAGRTWSALIIRQHTIQLAAQLRRWARRGKDESLANLRWRE